MSRELLSARSDAPAPRVSLIYLNREIVQAEGHMHRWTRIGVWDKAEWWEAYYERCHTWHYAWVRLRLPLHLHRCPKCGRIHQNDPGWLTCFACGEHWLDSV